MNLGQFLKTKREKASLSQGDVAKKLKYTSPQFISNWEREVSSPPIKVIKQLSSLYKVGNDELFNLILDHTLTQLKSSLAREYSVVVKRKKIK